MLGENQMRETSLTDRSIVRNITEAASAKVLSKKSFIGRRSLWAHFNRKAQLQLLNMANYQFSSYKSLASIGLLSLLVGLSSAACRTTEAASEPTDVQTIDSVGVNRSIEDDSSLATRAKAEAPDSEIDLADAFIEDEYESGALITAEEAGKESGLPTEQTDADGNLLPELIEGLEVGMPYSEARSLIIGEIWYPRTYPPIDTTYDAPVRNMQALGFEETRSCAGTGLGLCNMEFLEQEGTILTITVATSSEVPTVWTWSID